MKCPRCGLGHLGIKKYSNGDRLYIHKQCVGPQGAPEITDWCYVRYVRKPKCTIESASCRIKQAAIEAATKWGG